MEERISTKIITMNPRELKLLELNARYMKHEEYAKLVDNIKADGKLTSVPFACLEEDGKYTVLSGNHRVMASIDAGLEEIAVMVTDDKLSKDKKIAIQLSHNAITGQDDASILKELYESIESVDMKAYAGLDDEMLELLKKVNPVSISEANLEFQTVSVVFLPNELENARQVIEQANDLVMGDEAWYARFEEYDKWLDGLEVAGGAYGIKNTATGLKVIFDVFQKNVTDLAEIYDDEDQKQRYVPMYPIFGVSEVDLATAQVLRKAVQKMIDRQELKTDKKDDALLIMAEAYLESIKK